MSIISDALKKVSDQRSQVVRLQEEELGNIFLDNKSRARTQRKRWSALSSAGTLLIVAVAIAIFYFVANNINDTAIAPKITAPVVREPDHGAARKEVSSLVSLPSFTLSGIVGGGGESMAMIGNTILKKGDFYEGAQLVEISSDKVIMLYDNSEFILRIK